MDNPLDYTLSDAWEDGYCCGERGWRYKPPRVEETSVEHVDAYRRGYLVGQQDHDPFRQVTGKTGDGDVPL